MNYELEEYLKELKKRLRSLPCKERDEIIKYYEEYLSEADETETEALGSPEALSEKLLADNNICKKSKRYSASRIIFLIITFPIWLPLLAAWYVILISAVICIAAVELAFAACVPSSLFSLVCLAIKYSYLPWTLIYAGIAFFAAGAAILCFKPFFFAIKAVIRFGISTTAALLNAVGIRNNINRAGKEDA